MMRIELVWFCLTHRSTTVDGPVQRCDFSRWMDANDRCELRRAEVKWYEPKVPADVTTADAQQRLGQ